MKFARTIALSSTIAVALAQTLQSLPDCGKLCVNNMLAKARELGCADGDSICLCKNVDFAYGIRDCSHDVCGSEQAIPVIEYGSHYCISAGGNATEPNAPGVNPVPGPGKPSSTSDASLSTTTTLTQSLGSNTTSTMSVTASTSAVVTTITSGDTLITSTIGSATISSSTLVPSSSEGNPSSSTSGVDHPTSTSSAGAAKQTFYAGLAAAAGIAALVI